MDIISTIILGIVEGLTEFLPVSSTGHLILASKLLNLQQTPTLTCFEVSIQLGSILAVVFIYFSKLKQDINIWIKLAIGFIPTGAIGFLLHKYIKELFSPDVVAYMLIFWGIIFIIVEIFNKKEKIKTTTTTLDDVSYKQSFLIGLSQCLAMVPGTSRSGATIITGLLAGLDRKTAATFSFLLAIPTMFAATFYDSYKNRAIFIENMDNIFIFLLGGIVAFVVALLSIKIFLKFVSKFDYIPFGIYRIAVGLIFLLFIL